MIKKIISFCILIISCILITGCLNNKCNHQQIQYNWQYIKNTYNNYLNNDKNISQRQRTTRKTHVKVINDFIDK